ncbi:minor tail protein [Streptomyces phage Wakanda]|uniref:Minor tail protein n=1 Tax=Streptomyces phage Wakanda TaxID=2713267 RepID=A0A6G8R1F2_9CAUD|nr:minor tail protein [Streptomyces phage Wakanda]QIN94030.1 minor tail protein [Streptomyces phage Wakanda]
MLSGSTQLKNALQQGMALRSKPRVIAEWNHNRYTPIQTVDNFAYAEETYGYDLDMFPIESITEPLRPTAGLLKGRAGEGAVVQGYSDTPNVIRTYTASPDAKYKYWTSPEQSTTTPYSAGGYQIPATVQPHVLYSQTALTNKLYICIENSWANPKIWDIQITTDGTNWTTVASDLVPNSKGQVILYRQANGTWSTTVYRDNPVYIRGIRLVVKSMARIHSWFNLIEIGARLEKDLSDYLMDYSVKHDMGEADQITPIGIASSNTGSITLSNIDGIFNYDNEDSPYYGLIDANVKFIIDIGMDVSTWGGSGYEYIRQATMYSEAWGGGEEAVSINLKDASKFLQEMSPLPELMENISIGMAVWRMLDSVGFIDYAYTRDAEVASNRLSYFWTNEEQTVWNHIQDICRTTQSAVWFNEYGILQIKTRDSAFNRSAPVAWTLDYEKNGEKQPDIVDLEVGSTFEANKVTVKYTTTKLAEDEQGRPISEIVWQPEGDVVLRSSSLTTNMTATDTRFWIDKKDIAVWPYEGIVNIRGELIKYKGKGYRYYPKGGSYTGDIDKDTIFKVIYSLDEKRQIDNELSNSYHSWRNYFTGYMRVEERGWDESVPRAHDAVPDIWKHNGAYIGATGGTQKLWNGGLIHMPADGIMRMQTTGKKGVNGDTWYTARRGGVDNEPPKFIGTRVRFPSTPHGAHYVAGIWMWGDGGSNDMYGIEITTTKEADKYRKYKNEISIVRRTGGKLTRIGKGAVFAVTTNKWYDIDVAMTSANFTVMVNGTLVLRVSDSNSQQLPSTGRCGLYLRGQSVADFEYFYSLADGGIQDNDFDDSSYLDIIRGGYFSSQYYKDCVYKTRWFKKRRGRKSYWQKMWYNQRYFDEFGMSVHEVRPYEITFEKAPVLYSSLYVSNTDQVVVDEYFNDPFKAKFIIANAYPTNAIVNGEDTLTYGKDNPVTHKMVVTGRTVQRAEPKDYVVEDKQAIRARGEITLDFQSDWIQSESAAKALGDWIVKNWAEPTDEVEVNIFGNPLLQVGDIVAVNYPPKHMVATTHKYWVLSVTQQWDNGPTTSLTLRRARI